MMPLRPLVLASVAALANVACLALDEAPPIPPSAPADGLPATCNPLRTNGACLLPFPSAIFLKPDDSTETGYRVHLAPELFPVNAQGALFHPDRLNRADGFSPSTEILAYFDERIDASSLPPITDTSKSLDPSSATLIVDMDSGSLIEHFAEVDEQVYGDDDRQSLILRPSARLAAGGHYAVAITNAIRTKDGKVPRSPPGWIPIAYGGATDPLAVAQMQRMPDVIAALEGAGVPPVNLVLAWDFVTASDENLTHTMRAVRDETLASPPTGYTITSVEDDFSPHALRRVEGTFTVPRFLTEVDIAKADATLMFDDAGDPVDQGTYEAPFTLILPRAATAGPVKLLVFGHGFLGSGEDELGGPSGSYLQELADAKGYALVATNWTGLSKFEGLDAKGSGSAGLALQDLNHAVWITDRLHQAIANNIVLARTARDGIAKDAALFVGNQPVIDTTRVDYIGISLGGVMGSALLGFSPDLERGVLNVGAAGWCTLFQRSTNWALFKILLNGSYPDKLDQQIVLQVLQAHFDPVDGMSIAPHLLADPLEDNPPKLVLLQEAVNDVQVSNLATESYARTLAMPLLSDSPIDVAAFEKMDGPLASALTVWDLHEEAPPTTNTPAATDTPNKVHTELRALPKVEDQIDHFLRTGEVVSTCDGVCDPQ